MRSELPGTETRPGGPEHPDDCEHCRSIRDFTMPPALVSDFIAEKVIVFAGAGISTEGLRAPFRFYEDIAASVGINPEEGPPFPDLMEEFCRQPNGRREMLRRIRERFQYIEAFPELYRMATRFHRALATLFRVNTIVTTNWDDYFERECAAAPFVTAKDFALWDTPGRKVFKLHGSINNLGSIVATRTDYDRRSKELKEGLMGSQLSLLLATKTILYAGYSLRDDDFLALHEALRTEMGELFPHAYALTLENDVTRFNELGIIPIQTDATHFVEVLKEHMEDDGCFLPDERLAGVSVKLEQVRFKHAQLYETLDAHDHPEVLYAGHYQDGLLHGFERILARANSGDYSHICDVTRLAQTYEEKRKEALGNKRYHDVAYIEGYMNALIFLLMPDEGRETLPLYFLFGVDDQPVTFEEFNELRREAADLHKTAYRKARAFVRQFERGIVLHHEPFV